MSQDQQSEALRLAELLEQECSEISMSERFASAAELHRLHASDIALEDLRARIARIGLDIDKALRGEVVEASPAGGGRLSAIAALAAAPAAPAAVTDEQIDRIAEGMPGGLQGFLKEWGWRQFAREILNIRAMPAWEPQFDLMSPEQEALAILFCQEIAGPRGKPGRPPDEVRLLEMAQALYEAERKGAGPFTNSLACRSAKKLQVAHKTAGGADAWPPK